jgi:DNA sulfur modification protein DndE
MKIPLEHIRLSNQAKEQLTRIKRDTGISNWNTLCRWGFMLSLAEKGRPGTVDTRSDSNVEMTWKVFCGEHHQALTALFLLRCQHDNITTDFERTNEFRKHLGRGVGMLCSMQKRLNLVSLAEYAINQQCPT